MAVFSSSSWSKIWIYDIILTGVYTVWQILFCFSIRIDKRSKYSRRRTFDEDADIDYINERNMKFNKKLERFYGPYTTEIKQNLERGTAVWNDWLPIVAGGRIVHRILCKVTHFYSGETTVSRVWKLVDYLHYWLMGFTGHLYPGLYRTILFYQPCLTGAGG